MRVVKELQPGRRKTSWLSMVEQDWRVEDLEARIVRLILQEALCRDDIETVKHESTLVVGLQGFGASKP